jgi:sugar lactone lactonase YvrE
MPVRASIFGLALATIAATHIGLDATQPGTAGVAVQVLTMPDYPNTSAIWGASGADSQGRIWLGVTSDNDHTPSARLYRFEPAGGEVVDAGDVVSALKRTGHYKPGEKQMKIHSRIVQMPDGYLYFASMDESGERGDGSKMPIWGGHLWRVGPSGRWEPWLSRGRH